jgi:hypothetical protein
MSNPSARELTDALRTIKKPSVKQNIATFMKERASQIASKNASNIVITKKNIEPIISLAKSVYMPYKETDEKKTIIPKVNQIEPEIEEPEEQEEPEEKEPIQFDNVYESDDELQYAINASLQHQKQEEKKKMELTRMLKEANRRIALLQKEKEEESIAIMRLYEEDKKRREKEEEEKEEQRKCDELYKEFREKTFPLSRLMDSLGLIKTHIENILEKGEIVILRKQIYKSDNNWRDCDMLITNKKVYICIQSISTGYGGKLTLEDYSITPIYTFLNTLNSKYLKLLFSKPSFKKSDDERTILFIINDSDLESIIRCIPGSYINGHWKQLDGFFGPYFNEETIEISLVPPPLELK